MKTISIVVPTLGNSECLTTRIANKAKSLEHIKVDLVVVVNNTQAVTDQIGQQYRNVSIPSTILCQGKNTGFAAATNAGIRASKSEYVITLNDDAWVEPDFLLEMVKTQQKTGADMVASTIYKGESKEIDSCGFDFAWRGKAWSMKPVAANWQQHKSPLLESPLSEAPDNWLKNTELLSNKLSEDRLKQPFGPDAAAALYTRKLFDTVGLFNEAFFAYLEDVDLALRARRAGLTCTWAPKAIVHHQKHATSSQMGKFKQQQDVKNWWRLVAGSYPREAWLRFGGQILLERMRNVKGLLV